MKSGGSSSQFLKADGSVDGSTYLTSGSYLENVVEDTTPQLGGNLDLNSKNITGTGNAQIVGVITATSAVPTWTLGASGSDHYTFTGNGFTSATNDPDIYLMRGQRYAFLNNAGTNHPFWIKTTPGTGTGNPYNTGVTNNGAQSGYVTFNVPMDAPAHLYYQCQAHGNMVGNIYVVGVRINTNGNVELGIGTVSIASTVGGSVRDDAWHYAYVESKNESGAQKISLSVDGGDYSSVFFPLAGDKELITNANLTPPILKNSYNSGIFVDDIFSTIVIGSASSTPPSSGISSYTVDSNTVTYDDFEDQIGSEQELSIDTTVVSGQVASLVNSSSTLTGIVTAINSAVIDTPIGVATNFRATATATISEGFVNTVSIASSGAGYLTTPTVAVSAPTGTASEFTATGRAKLNGYGQISEFEILTMGGGYLSAPSVTIDAPLGQTAEGYGNVDASGAITSITFTKTGIGYTVPPTVSIANTIGDRDGVSGFATATGVVVLDAAANDIESIHITSPGAGYLGPCTVLVQDPAALAGNAGIGTFWFNEVVIGASSSVSARVKNWDQDEGVLQVGQENGTFFAGENIIGQSSGAIYVLDKYMLLSEVPAAGSVENIDDYNQNDLFEGEADMILDFTEVNPFGDV